MEKSNLPGLSPLWLISLALILGVFLTSALPLILMTRAPADWIGFSGSLIGSGCTILAAWWAYHAIQVQIRDARDEVRRRQIFELTAEVSLGEQNLDRLRTAHGYLRTFTSHFQNKDGTPKKGSITEIYRMVRQRGDDFISSTATQAPYGYGERILTVMSRLEAIGNRITESTRNYDGTQIARMFDNALVESIAGVNTIATQIEADIPIYQKHWLAKFDELQRIQDRAH